MTLLRALADPALAGLVWPVLAAGLAIALMGAPLSVLVVLKRLSFAGQGVSHAGFAGVGLATALGLAGAADSPAHAWARLAVVLGVCLAATLGIARLTRRGAAHAHADTAIGIVLVFAMALGAVLVHLAVRAGRPAGPGWESILFGSIVAVGPADAAAAWLVAAVVLLALAAARRPLLFWAFDEPAAEAFGVPVAPMKYLLFVLVALVIVAAMKLAGVVLATAMLVLPGAAALVLSDRFSRVLLLSLAIAAACSVGGIALAFELDLPAGACIVGALAGVYAAARALAWLRAPSARPPTIAPADA